jgi:hypothetical protein
VGIGKVKEGAVGLGSSFSLSQKGIGVELERIFLPWGKMGATRLKQLYLAQLHLAHLHTAIIRCQQKTVAAESK